jgi:EpsD family peptidyl-prolyl cis-trans isomerase
METVMSNLSKRLLLISAACVALAACGEKDAKPEGQVVATVDGQEVTINEVTMEANGLGVQAGNISPKLVESVGLARVIERKMLAAEAKLRKLDQSPQYVLAKARNDENLLVQALQAEVSGKVSETPREQAQKFISDNPIIFGDRRILTLDQIQFLQPSNLAALPLNSAKSMQQVERILLDANIEFRRAPQQLDTLLLDPRLSKEVVRLAQGPNGEPFMFTDQPQGAPAPIVYINVVSEQKTEPFIGERAISYAQQLIQRQEVSKRLQAELTRLRNANKGKIVYGAGYDTPENTAKELDRKATEAAREKAEQDKRAKAGGAKAQAPAQAPAAAK